MHSIKTNTLKLSRRTIILIVVSLILVATSVFVTVRVARADRLDELNQAISDLNAQSDQISSQINDLKAQAGSYEQMISMLQTQISGVEAQIAVNQAQQDEIQRQINEQQVQLDQQKLVLGKNIKQMYTSSEMTTIEMLATSKSLSDFIDKDTYRNAVQRQIQDTMQKIQTLQNELNAKKAEIDKLLKEQEAQRATLSASRQEQANLLSMNQGQQNAFNGQLSANKSRRAELMKEQQRLLCEAYGCGGGSVGGGGYPWGTVPCLHGGQVKGPCYDYEWGVNGSWMNWQNGGKGYAYRNCTDYVAWKTGAPGGLGNANQWDDRAPSYGYSVGSAPRNGAAAIDNSGGYGHVMYVEAVYGDGSVLISDYNRAGPGEYGTKVLTPSQASRLKYVYF